jgi:hypothetical protein
MHVLDRLVQGSHSSEEVSLLMGLAERVDVNCDGHAAVLSQLLKVLNERPDELSEAHRQSLTHIAARKLSDPRATSLVSAAILLANIYDQVSWIEAIAAVAETLPIRYETLLSQLSIPIEMRKALAQRLAASDSFDVRIRAGIELCEVGLADEGCIVFHDLFSGDGEASRLSWKRAVFDTDFIDVLSQFSIADRFGDELSDVLEEVLSASNAAPLTARVYALFNIVLQTATDDSREKLLRLFQSMENKMVKLLWGAASAEVKGEFLEALKILWFVCLRVPEQAWLRQRTREIASKAGASDWTTRLLTDEYSFFRRKNELALAEAALDQLKSITGNLYLDRLLSL